MLSHVPMPRPLREGRTGEVATQALASLHVVGLERDLGVEREALQRGAQLAGQGERSRIAPAAEGPASFGAALRQDAPPLDRGGVELGQERLLALARGFPGLAARMPAACEVAQDAALEEGHELGDVAIGGRLDGLEARPSERTRAGVDPVEDPRVEVEVEVRRAAEALRNDHRAPASGRAARALAQPGEERAHQDAPHARGEARVVGEVQAHRVGAGEHPLA
jgi:hypothetical protein